MREIHLQEVSHRIDGDYPISRKTPAGNFVRYLFSDIYKTMELSLKQKILVKKTERLIYQHQ
jgi:hypothetical protein